MTATDAKRRTLLKGGLVLGLLSSSPRLWCAPRESTAAQCQWALAGCRDTSGQYYMAGVSLQDQRQFLLPVASRVHDVVAIPRLNRALFIARRPGQQIYSVDLASGALTHTKQAAAGRHFYGHAALSADQQWLFTSENAYASGAGKIGVYRVADELIREGEFPSFGVGPHQLKLSPSGSHLVVANGGLRTHPDTGRKILNISTMKSNLAYIDVASGALAEHIEAPKPKVSIRHLAMSEQGLAVAATQYHGDSTDEAPALLIHKFGKPPSWQSLPELTQLATDHYIGSVAIDPAGQEALLSCPRGNLFVHYDLIQQQVKAEITSQDACGVFHRAGKWFTSNGVGELMALESIAQAQGTAVSSTRTLHWDNHLLII